MLSSRMSFCEMSLMGKHKVSINKQIKYRFIVSKVKKTGLVSK